MQKATRKQAIFGILFTTCIFALLSISCTASRPKTFIVSHDQTANWRVIEVRKDINAREKVWNTIVDTIATKYDLEVIERDSGYLRTSWKYTYMIRQSVSDKYRSRLVVKLNQESTQAKIKIESNWLSSSGWVGGYDTALLEDVYSDLQGKIGRVISR